MNKVINKNQITHIILYDEILLDSVKYREEFSKFFGLIKKQEGYYEGNSEFIFDTNKHFRKQDSVFQKCSIDIYFVTKNKITLFFESKSKMELFVKKNFNDLNTVII